MARTYSCSNGGTIYQDTVVSESCTLIPSYTGNGKCAGDSPTCDGSGGK